MAAHSRPNHQAFGTNSAVTIANTAGAILDLNAITTASARSLAVALRVANRPRFRQADRGRRQHQPIRLRRCDLRHRIPLQDGQRRLVLSGLNTLVAERPWTTAPDTQQWRQCGAIRGTLTVNSGATVTHPQLATPSVTTPAPRSIPKYRRWHTNPQLPSNLTLSSATVNMTGGTLQSTGAGVIDIYDAQALGGGNPDSIRPSTPWPASPPRPSPEIAAAPG